MEEQQSSLNNVSEEKVKKFNEVAREIEGYISKLCSTKEFIYEETFFVGVLSTYLFISDTLRTISKHKDKLDDKILDENTKHIMDVLSKAIKPE
jgi:hypothetical protein